MRRIWLVTSWIVSTVAVSWLTFQALNAAQAGVTDQPLAQVVVASADDTTSTGRDLPAQPGSAAPTNPPTIGPGTGTAPDHTSGSNGSHSTRTHSEDSATTTSTAAGTSTTTTAGPTPSTTSTTGGAESSSTTSTTSTTEAWSVTTLTSDGGTLTVSYRPGEVRYEAAVPAAGYSLELDSTTSPDIRVTFVGAADAWELRARWHDGAFDPEVKQK
jgi:hypothetical protein